MQKLIANLDLERGIYKAYFVIRWALTVRLFQTFLTYFAPFGYFGNVYFMYFEFQFAASLKFKFTEILNDIFTDSYLLVLPNIQYSC